MAQTSQKEECDEPFCSPRRTKLLRDYPAPYQKIWPSDPESKGSSDYNYFSAGKVQASPWAGVPDTLN